MATFVRRRRCLAALLTLLATSGVHAQRVNRFRVWRLCLEATERVRATCAADCASDRAAGLVEATLCRNGCEAEYRAAFERCQPWAEEIRRAREEAYCR